MQPCSRPLQGRKQTMSLGWVRLRDRVCPGRQGGCPELTSPTAPGPAEQSGLSHRRAACPTAEQAAVGCPASEARTARARNSAGHCGGCRGHARLDSGVSHKTHGCSPASRISDPSYRVRKVPRARIANRVKKVSVNILFFHIFRSERNIW